MTLQEIEQKREYLNSLRKFTSEELKLIRGDIIKMNTHENPREEELKGIITVYDNINYIIQEESSFPYPKGYRHPLSEEFLQDLNRTILLYYSCYLPCEKGFYRLGHSDTIDGMILPSKGIFIPRLKELIEYYGTTDSDLISKLAYFHLEFLTKIHPFYDGNGRTARAFMNLELARAGYPMIGLKYNDVEAYNEAFTTYIAKNDKSPMEELILKNIDSELDKQILIKKLI